MRLLTILAVFFVFAQLSSGYVIYKFADYGPANCLPQPCVKRGSPSTCTQGYYSYDSKLCGTLWLKTQEICCPNRIAIRD